MKAFVLLHFSILIAALPAVSEACKCATPANEELSLVFEGKVMAIEELTNAKNPDQRYKVSFSVINTLKGIEQNAVVVFTASPALCGMHYDVGKTYIVPTVLDGLLKTRYCYKWTMPPSSH